MTSKQIVRMAVTYAIIGAFGSALVIMLVPILQVRKVESLLDEAESSLKDRKPDSALRSLAQVEPWAQLHPYYRQRFVSLGIQSRVRTGETEEAERIAAGALKDFPGTPATGPWDVIQKPAWLFLNARLTSTGRTVQGGPWYGYHLLATELKLVNDVHRMNWLSGLLLKSDPENPIGLSLRDYAAERLPSAPPESAPAPAHIPAPAPVPVPAPPAKPSPLKTIGELILKAEWDQALAACDAALKDGTADRPSLLRLKKVATTRGLKWGAVRTQKAPAFDTTGNPIATLAPGTLVEILRTVQRPKSPEMAFCSLKGETRLPEEFVMRAYDLVIVPGRLADAPEPARQLRKKEGELLAAVTEAKRKKQEAVNPNNPHSAEYQAAKTAYDAFWKKVAQLTKLRDSTSGDSQVRYSDELQKMKGQDIRLGLALEEAKKKHNQWEAEHPTSSSHIQALESELTSLRVKIAAEEEAAAASP